MVELQLKQLLFPELCSPSKEYWFSVFFNSSALLIGLIPLIVASVHVASLVRTLKTTFETYLDA